ncbi:probable cyclin-dependent serine/threonine-protein kinase DDB_G0292550 isoform X1 [Drosophila willistoni]|nr:probable cyclin-dependent serine/threonine-protein kinase DDB_G0292550 isoform X1 [Drosophila willistoni]
MSNHWALAWAAGATVPAPQPSMPPPLPSAPPPPPPSDQPSATVATPATVMPVSYGVTPVAGAAASSQSANPYEQYTPAQYAAMTPEQQYALQQHWQQWQAYQQEYAKWHAQYGEQYKREMAAAATTGTTAAAPVATAATQPIATPVVVPVAAPPANPPVPQVAPPGPQAYPPSNPYYTSSVPAVGVQVLPPNASKITAQPQIYNQPPPPPMPQESWSHQKHTAPAPNQYYTQPAVPSAGRADDQSSGFANLQQPPPFVGGEIGDPKLKHPPPNLWRGGQGQGPGPGQGGGTWEGGPPKRDGPPKNHWNDSNNSNFGTGEGGRPGRWSNDGPGSRWSGPPSNSEGGTATGTSGGESRGWNSRNEGNSEGRWRGPNDNETIGGGGSGRWNGPHNAGSGRNGPSDSAGGGNASSNEPVRGGGFGGSNNKQRRWEDDENRSSSNRWQFNSQDKDNNRKNWNDGDDDGGGVGSNQRNTTNPFNTNNPPQSSNDYGSYENNSRGAGNRDNFGRNGPKSSDSNYGNNQKSSQDGPGFEMRTDFGNFGRGRWDGGNQQQQQNQQQRGGGVGGSGVGGGGVGGGGVGGGVGGGGGGGGSNDGGFRSQFGNNPQQQPQRGSDLNEVNFDRLFYQWEQQFENWKRENANHPDREEYRRYEEEFEKQRRNIAEKCEQMRRRRQMQQQSPQTSGGGGGSGVGVGAGGVGGGSGGDFGGNSGRYQEPDTTKDGNASKDSDSRDLVKETFSRSGHGRVGQSKPDESSVSDAPKFMEPPLNQQKQQNPQSQKLSQPSMSLGKRKYEESITNEKNQSMLATASKQVKPQENIITISLDDDDDEDDDDANNGGGKGDNDDDNATAADRGDGNANPDHHETPMTNIFKKSEGIPGLDLVEGDAKSSKPIADIAEGMKDTEFINNLSQAVAQASGNGKPQGTKDDPKQSKLNEPGNEGGAICFTGWLKKRKNGGDGGGNKSSESEQKKPDESIESSERRGEGNMPGRGLNQRGGAGVRGNFNDYGPGGGPGNGPQGGPQGMGNNFNDFGPGVGQGGGPQGMGNNFNDFGPGGGPQGMGNNFNDFGGPPFNSRPPFNSNNFDMNDPRQFGPNNFGPNNNNFGHGRRFNEPHRGDPNYGPDYRGPGPGAGPGPGPFGGPFGNKFGPNNNNNNNSNQHPNNDNPFRRQGGGMPMPNFDDGPGPGPGPGPGHGGNGGFRGGRGPHPNARQFGQQQRNNFGGHPGNQNRKHGPNGDEHTINQQSHPNEPVYRPMQVFDYKNSNTAAKVIDYGHKSVETGPRISPGLGPGSCLPPEPDFRPVKTFEYGHASRNIPMTPILDQGMGNVGPGFRGTGGPLPTNNNTSNNNNSNNVNSKRRNRKKNKKERQQARMQMHLNRQLQSVPSAESDEIIQNNAQTTIEKPSIAEPQAEDSHEMMANDASNQATEDLEDISDGEENLLQEHTIPIPATLQHQEQQSAPSEAEPPADLSAIQPAKVQLPEFCVPTNENFNTISIDEVLIQPGRLTRPKRMCIILRGPPGSGKSYVVRLIKDKEVEMGGSNPRILSIDDYFIIENDYDEKCPKTGKKIPKKEILYEYDETMEETYMQYLIKSYKKTLSDNLHDFIIVDCNNNSLRTLNEFYCHAKDANFVPYIVDLHCDLETCLGRNSHKRSEKDIQLVLDNWCATPLHYIKLDVTSLLENVVEMEDVENMATDDNAFNEDSTSVSTGPATTNPHDIAEEDDSNSADALNSYGFLKSKWENDTSKDSLARLDGTKHLLGKRKTSMADYLQIDDWIPPSSSSNGKKRVRWADIEERRAQEKMRAIGFVVGQTDWKRMMDPNAGNRALNKTKFIERVNKQRR